MNAVTRRAQREPERGREAEAPTEIPALGWWDISWRVFRRLGDNRVGLAAAALGPAIVYRYAPARERAQWRWVTWGSAIAATLWFMATAALSDSTIRHGAPLGERGAYAADTVGPRAGGRSAQGSA